MGDCISFVPERVPMTHFIDRPDGNSRESVRLRIELQRNVVLCNRWINFQQPTEKEQIVVYNEAYLLKLYRKKVYLVPPSSELTANPEFEYALHFKKQDNKFRLTFLQRDPLYPALFEFIGKKQTPLEPGDTFRNGDIAYRFLGLETPEHNWLSTAYKIPNRIDSAIRIAQEISCRICYQTDDKPQNRLISPCFCTGSGNFIHTTCLNSWLFKSTGISSHGHLYQFKEYLCQVCKAPLNSNSDVFKYLISNLYGLSDQIVVSPSVYLELRHVGEVTRNRCLGKFFIAPDGPIKLAKERLLRNGMADHMFGIELQYRDKKLYLKDFNSLHGTGIRKTNTKLLSCKQVSLVLAQCYLLNCSVESF